MFIYFLRHISMNYWMNSYLEEYGSPNQDIPFSKYFSRPNIPKMSEILFLCWKLISSITFYNIYKYNQNWLIHVLQNIESTILLFSNDIISFLYWNVLVTVIWRFTDIWDIQQVQNINKFFWFNISVHSNSSAGKGSGRTGQFDWFRRWAIRCTGREVESGLCSLMISFHRSYRKRYPIKDRL